MLLGDEKTPDVVGKNLLSAELSPDAIGYPDNRIGVFYKAAELSRLAERGNRNLSRLKQVFIPLDELGDVSQGARCKLMENGVELGVMLPAVVSESELNAVKNMLNDAKKQGIMTTLVCNTGHIILCRELGFKLFGDIRLNIYNSFSRELYAYAGITSASLSPELTLPQARDVGGYAVTLGRLPLMITERCFIKENFGCESCGKAALSDRRGVRFPMMRCFDHRNIILNSSVTYMGDKREELRRAGSVGEYLLFTCESAGEIADLLESYFKGKPLNSEMRRMGKREAN
jgi:putative protease